MTKSPDFNRTIEGSLPETLSGPDLDPRTKGAYRAFMPTAEQRTLIWEHKNMQGVAYSPPIKSTPILKAVTAHLVGMEELGEFGDNVVDVGSGVGCDLFNFLQRRRGRNIISIDLVERPPSHRNCSLLHLQMDIEQLMHMQGDVRSKLAQAADFLIVERCSASYTPQPVNSAIFSNVLNYVDYQEVLRAIQRYMAPGSRTIIVNGVGHGLQRAFSPRRPRSNKELQAFLSDELGLRTEYLALDTIGSGKKPDELGMVVVARK